MISTQQALGLANAAFGAVFGRPPTVPEARLLLAKGMKETGWGSGWKRPAGDTGTWPPNNIGAIQAGPGWQGPTFVYADRRADGTPYTTTWRKYTTALDGWTDFVRELYQNPNRGRGAVLAAAAADDPWAFSVQVVETGYTEGVGPTTLERAQWHYRWMAPAIRDIDQALGWPAPAHDSGGGSAWPFPPPADPAPAPPNAPSSPPLDGGQMTERLIKALGDCTLALGTVHQDLAALRADLAQFRAELSRAPKLAMGAG